MASYDIKQVNKDKKAALSEANKVYDGMIKSSDKFYQKQIDAQNQWADKQSQLQQEQTDFTIEKIEQQKDQAHKDYLKEQSGAYVDWQKQSNDYGVNAERMAQNGLLGSGFSESSQVSMYNTYQNRVATARESYNRAVLNYDNAIKDARLQNNSALAEIAYRALQSQLELSLQGFQYKNQLLLAKLDKKAEIDDRYYNRYQDVLSQIRTRSSSSGSVSKKRKKIDDETGKLKEDDNPVVDMGSVLDLGYGPINAKKLNELVVSGKVIETEKNGVLTYSKKK